MISCTSCLFVIHQRSQRADREELELAERAALANALLRDDDDDEQDGGLEARSSNWANFLKGKKKGRKRL